MRHTHHVVQLPRVVQHSIGTMDPQVPLTRARAQLPELCRRVAPIAAIVPVDQVAGLLASLPLPSRRGERRRGLAVTLPTADSSGAPSDPALKRTYREPISLLSSPTRLPPGASRCRRLPPLRFSVLFSPVFADPESRNISCLLLISFLLRARDGRLSRRREAARFTRVRRASSTRAGATTNAGL